MRSRGRLAPTRAVSPQRGPEADDATLIAAARVGDGSAFASLFRRHADAVRTRITRLVGPVAERDDLVQKVFIALHRGLPTYRNEAKLSTYLHRIAVNIAYDHLRWRTRAPEDEGALDAATPFEQLGPALDDQVAARADLARLLALLDQLSPKKRIAKGPPWPCASPLTCILYCPSPVTWTFRSARLSVTFRRFTSRVALLSIFASS